jgi:beta-1,4-mannosyl-glycoprotein beta-1,4-N-acetylglucosaminyltransferase
MIWNVLPFFNELDLLELRLLELGGVVDRFVVSECDLTYSGRKKALYYKENRKRFEEWSGRIIHSVVSCCPVAAHSPWDRERHQRDSVKGVFNPAPGDTVIYTDADEIPHPSVCERFNRDAGWAALDMLWLCYKPTIRRFERWRFGLICTGAWWNSQPSPHMVRFKIMAPEDANWWVPEKHLVRPGGWHIQWQGGAIARVLKARSMSHCNDRGTPAFIRRTKRGIEWDLRLKEVVPDKRWPKNLPLATAWLNRHTSS